MFDIVVFSVDVLVCCGMFQSLIYRSLFSLSRFVIMHNAREMCHLEFRYTQLTELEYLSFLSQPANLLSNMVLTADNIMIA